MNKIIMLRQLCVVMSLLFILFSCRQDEKKHVEVHPVQTIHITANFPPGVFAVIQTHFKSIPTKFGCKHITMLDGSFVPNQKYETDTLHENEKEIFIPLKLKRSSKCQWNYISTQITCINKEKNGEFEGAGVSIYPRNDDKSAARHFKTNNPVNIYCKKCTNPNFDPPVKFFKCLDFNEEDENDWAVYYFDDIKKDTIDIVINLSLEK